MRARSVGNHFLGQFDDLFFEFGPVLEKVHQPLRTLDLLDDLGVILDEFERGLSTSLSSFRTYSIACGSSS